MLISNPDAPRRTPAGPEPSPEPVLEPGPGPFIYIVRTGDTLHAIALRFGVTPEAIVETNQLRDPDLIWPGQRLLIPGPKSQPEPEPSSLKPEPIQLPIPEPEPQLTPDPLPFAPGASLPPIPWSDDSVRAIYVSYFALGREEHRRRVFDLVTETEINALLIDVKGDFGLVNYPTRVALAHDIGAAQPTARDLDELVDFFKGKNVYTIARIVAFRDNLFANVHPDLAVHRQDGGYGKTEMDWPGLIPSSGTPGSITPTWLRKQFVLASMKYNLTMCASPLVARMEHLSFRGLSIAKHGWRLSPLFSALSTEGWNRWEYVLQPMCLVMPAGARTTRSSGKILGIWPVIWKSFVLCCTHPLLEVGSPNTNMLSPILTRSFTRV